MVDFSEWAKYFMSTADVLFDVLLSTGVKNTGMPLYGDFDSRTDWGIGPFDRKRYTVTEKGVDGIVCLIGLWGIELISYRQLAKYRLYTVLWRFDR